MKNIIKNDLWGKVMKFKILFIFILLFSSCCAIPGYINKDGAITPKYFKEIQIE